MAEASSSRIPRPHHSRSADRAEDEYPDIQKPSTRSRQRTPGQQQTPRRNDSYREPQDWRNINDAKIPPPVASNRAPLRENAKFRSVDFEAFVQRRPSAGDGRDDYDLTMPTGPPPVRSPDTPPPASPTLPIQRQSSEAPGRGEASEDSSTAPPPFVQRRPEDYIHHERPPNPVPNALMQLYTVSYLIFFSILGTLARLGVQWLTFYPGAPIVTPVLWANFGGSILMGFLSEDQGLFKNATVEVARVSEKRDTTQELTKAEHTKHRKTIPLFIGLATGFCGSFTSYSSFSRDMFLALSNDLPTPIDHPTAGTPSASSTVSRPRGYSFEAVTAVIIFTLAVSLGGLILGAHLALFTTPRTRSIPTRFLRRFLDPLIVLLGWGSWLGAIFLTIWPPDRHANEETWRGQVFFALVFAPVGCLIRFYASLKLNGLVPSFPLGTFAVNMLGTAIEGMCYDIQHVGVGVMGRIGGGRVGCQVLQGVQDGFCGCLTTVSTWVAEINGLRRKHGYLYALMSVLSALCLMVVIMGSVRWTVEFSTPACNTGYPDKIHG